MIRIQNRVLSFAQRLFPFMRGLMARKRSRAVALSGKSGGFIASMVLVAAPLAVPDPEAGGLRGPQEAQCVAMREALTRPLSLRGVRWWIVASFAAFLISLSGDSTLRTISVSGCMIITMRSTPFSEQTWASSPPGSSR